MFTEPTDLTMAQVHDALERHWGMTDVALGWLALGFGSHHWRATEPNGQAWFVTVDDHREGRMGFPAETSVGGLERAMRIALTLRDAAGLAFVLAPVPSRTGEVVRPIDGTSYSIAVFPNVTAEPVGPGPYPDEADRQAVLGMIGRVHRASARIPDELPRREDFDVPGRAGLLAALDALEEPWRTGPYGEPARLLLREHRAAIVDVLAAFDRLIVPILADQADWVVTHGEPHARNVLRDRGGALLLVDWDTVAIGPRERDLWMLVPESGPADWSAYTDVTGVGTVSEMAILAYRMWWDLSETATFVAWFRHPHEAMADTATGWAGLSGTFPLSPEYLAGEVATGRAPR